METVIEILTELKNDAENLKSYDRSVMWNSWGYVYFSDGKYDLSKDAYVKVINEPEVTIPIKSFCAFNISSIKSSSRKL